MERIECIVESISYNDPESGFTVFKSTLPGSSYPRSFVGNMYGIRVGSVLEVTGEWKVDKYGRKFSIVSYFEKAPKTLEGLEAYLGGGLIKGIGPKYAHSIVETFGYKTLSILEEEIDRLVEVPGIGADRLKKIKKGWEEQKGIRDIMMFLQGNGLSANAALKIYKKYGSKSIEKVKEDPYRLIDDIDGIGFKLSDSIAQSLGYRLDDPRRCKSGLKYALKMGSTSGHVYLERRELVLSTSKLLKISPDPIDRELDVLLEFNELIEERDVESGEIAIYLPLYYYSESRSAENINRLLKSGGGNLDIDVEEAIKLTRNSYDPTQEEAIRESVRSKVMVLTGGPGTGKTYTTNGIIKVLEGSGLRLLLAAPTGRAAKRMNESTKREDARTIHRLLEYAPETGNFKRNRENPLEGDALIIDESSMIDILLFYSLVDAIPDHMKLILVGDVDQLPSVGPGNVLKDIIESGIVPVIKLTTIFRQSQDSDIITNSHKINKGEFINLSKKSSDFIFIEEENSKRIASRIVQIVSNYIPERFNYTTDQIQVLSPMKKGEIGTINLNNMIQASINFRNGGLTYGNYTFKVGDRVMQMKNDYDKNVYNGDIGKIVSIDLDFKLIEVLFDDHIVEYEDSDFDELTLAYATTIHKSQGSEYPVVVMPISMDHFVMLQRNLIYTGLTRSKKLCVMVGTEKAIDYSIKNLTVQNRNTRLKERLQRLL